MHLTMSLIQADLIAARQAIDYYNEKGIRDIKNIAAYHIQQAAEKLIKIQIYASNAKIDFASLYTHNIEKLLYYAESINVSLIVPKYFRENSLILTGWEAGSRYDIGFRIRIDTLKKAADALERWFNEVLAMGIKEA